MGALTHGKACRKGPVIWKEPPETTMVTLKKHSSLVSREDDFAEKHENNDFDEK